ncbi:MAG: FprA family A-type flavoprotein [Lachnospiraceae bacterium]|nr:FprA family A-type flavoprotein [Lachnospiraceae bacterium]
MTITSDIQYVGVNDHSIDLFEGLYVVPKGISYNSYIIMDEKVAVLDTVDARFTEQWLQSMQQALKGRKPDYLIVQHMEPDHSAGIMCFMEQYPEAVLVATAKAFGMMQNFFGREFSKQCISVSDGDMLSLGRHKLLFTTAPMVHWPEVMVTYDSTDKILFSADAFGKFGALDADEEWLPEARRYYFGIVGKYGIYVQKLLQKVATWEIGKICPLHGPVLWSNLAYYLKLYQTWSTYQPEEEGVLIAYTSIYGNTRKAVLRLEHQLRQRGCPVVVRDLARCDMSEAVAQAFRYSKLVLATTTYNAGIFPPMREFIGWLIERYYSNRMVAFMENGSWAVAAAMLMRQKMEKCKGLVFAEHTVRILSALNQESIGQLEQLTEELCKELAENR